MIQWSPIVAPFVILHSFEEISFGLALHEAVQSLAPSSGRPQLVQPAQLSPGSPQSRHISQKPSTPRSSPSKLQNMPGGQVESVSQYAPVWDPC